MVQQATRPRAHELNELIRYTMWSVFRVTDRAVPTGGVGWPPTVHDSPVNSVSRDVVAAELTELLGQAADKGTVTRGCYDVQGLRAGADYIGAEATFVSRVGLSNPDWPGASAADPSGEPAEPEGDTTVLGSYGRVSGEVPVGFRIKLHPGMVTTAALRTGRPARINSERLATGPFGAIVGRLGMRAAVATPIVVEGRYWGVAVAATSQEDFPPGTESRMAEFMELAATAIANAQAEQRLRELADTQASLRRLAMLVARGESPEAVFAAVTREALRHFGNGTARMIRFELDGTATLVANEGTTAPMCGSANAGRAIRRLG
jgi:GAF domain-containing protein